MVILSEAARQTGERIARVLDGELHGAAARVVGADVSFPEAKAHLQSLFLSGRPVLAVMASGALIRILAPVLADKHREPPVIAIAEDGSSVVPLLGGHHGANDLARQIASELGGHAAITTAGDLKFGVALDQPPKGYVLANPDNAKAVMAELVAGAGVRVMVGVSCLDTPLWPAGHLPLKGGDLIAASVSTVSARSGDAEQDTHPISPLEGRWPAGQRGVCPTRLGCASHRRMAQKFPTSLRQRGPRDADRDRYTKKAGRP